MTQNILTYVFAGIAAGGAIGMLLTKNIFHAALLLLVVLLSIAGIFVLLSAEFLAVSQILMYAGGVIVLILFGIMLTRGNPNRLQELESGNKLAGMLVGLVAFSLLFKSLWTADLGSERSIEFDTVSETGRSIITNFIVSFELMGILLLAALIGAAYVSSQKQSDAG